MKFAPSLLAAAVFAACLSDERGPVPTALPDAVAPPTPPASPPVPNAASLRILIIEASGTCLLGATVRVTGGGAPGRTATQDKPCSVWDYGDLGAVLKDLTPGVAVTVLVSASGHVPRELTLIPPSAHEVELVPDRK